MPNKKADCKQKQSKRSYAKVELAILSDKKVSLKQLKVYVALCKFADNKTGFCYPSNEQIQEITQLDIRDIKRTTKQLCELGWIEKTVIKSRKHANEYHVLPEKTGSKKVLELAPSRVGESPTQKKNRKGGRITHGSNHPPQLNPYLHQGEDYLHQGEEVSITTTNTRGMVH